MDDYSANVFNYCIGAFALFSTLTSLYRYYCSSLPARKIVALNEILTEIRDIYEKAEAESLFPSDAERHHARGRLTDLEILTNELRERAYSSTSAMQEFRSLLKGLSQTIAETMDRAKQLRGTIMSTTEEERRRRRMQALEARPCCAGRVVAVPQADSQCENGTDSLLPPSRTSTMVEEAGSPSIEEHKQPFLQVLRMKLRSILLSGWAPSEKSLKPEAQTTYPETIPPV